MNLFGTVEKERNNGRCKEAQVWIGGQKIVLKGRQVWGGKAAFQEYLEKLSKVNDTVVAQAKIETEAFEDEPSANVNVKVFTASGLLAALRDVDAARAAARTAQTETAPQAETARNGRSRSRV